MIFEHRRSLKKAIALDLGFWLFTIPLFLVFATWLVFVQKEAAGISAGKVMFWVIGMASAFLSWNIIRFSRGKGEWVIQLTPDEVIWQAPENIAQESFRVPVSEIAKIVCELSRSNENSHRHYLETTQGKLHLLDPSISGMHIGKFCIALEQLGVKYETRHVF